MRKAGRVALALAAVLPQFALVALAGWLAVPVPRSVLRGDEFRSLVLTDRYGEELRVVRSAPWGVARWLSLDEMGERLPAMAVEIEDRRFRRHPGLDPAGLARAFLANLRARRIVAGGSTISQQLVRNLHPGARRTTAVKAAEALEALRLERHTGKRTILEAYLNRVPFGNGAYGAEAASRLYFGRACRELSAAQAAFLVGIARAPEHYDPYRHYRRARERQRVVLATLRSRQLLGEFEYRQALAESVIPLRPQGRFLAPHFTDMVLARGGVRGCDRVRTTLDLPLQRTCEDLLDRQLGLLAGNRVTNGAVVVLDRRSGDILAMVGSRDWFDPGEGQVNACLSPRQTGSAVKPFAYALAFEAGMSPASILPDLPTWFSEDGGDYRPVNYDRAWHGPVSARTALACSYNIPAVKALEFTGPERLLRLLRDAGVTTLDRPAGHYGLALALGVGDIPLLELANAYRALANGGRWSPVRALGDDEPGEGRQVLGEQAAWLVTSILSDNDARAGGFGEFSCLDMPFTCAVKTGTSKDYRDNWAIGYTSDCLVGVWVGNFDGTPMCRVSGVTGAGPLFRDVMLAAQRNEPGPFRMPEGVVARRVCPASGRAPGPDCPGAVTDYFMRGAGPPGECDVHRLCAFDPHDGRPLAGCFDSTAAEWRVVECYPPEYRAWMQEQGMVLPPFEEQGRDAGGPVVLFPDDGDVFKLDPDLGRADQAVKLRAAVPAGTTEAVWLVDGREVARVEPPYGWFWELEPGEHSVLVRAGNRASEPVSFLVLP